MKKIVMSALTLAIAACMSAAPVISASASDDFVCGTPLIMKELAERDYEGIRLELPEKKYYKEGEELDLSGGKIYLDDVFLCYMDYTNGCYIEGAEVEVDTHQFISSSIPGVYPINIKVTLNGKEYHKVFCVCVEESEGSDIEIEDVKIGEDAYEFVCGTPMIEQKKENFTLDIKVPDKKYYQYGEKLDLTGGEIYAGDKFICSMTDPTANVEIDTHQFVNSDFGAYPINIKATVDGKNYYGIFCVAVEEPENAEIKLHDIKINDDSVLFGDVNLDGKVTISDSVRIMQYVANSQKYDLTDEQKVNADVYNTGDGVTVNDAAAIESYLSGTVDSLPLTF